MRALFSKKPHEEMTIGSIAQLDALFAKLPMAHSERKLEYPYGPQCFPVDDELIEQAS